MHATDGAHAKARETEQERRLEEQRPEERGLRALARLQHQGGRHRRAGHEGRKEEERPGGEPEVPLRQLVSRPRDDSGHVRGVGPEREKSAGVHRPRDGGEQGPEDVSFESDLVEEEALHEELSLVGAGRTRWGSPLAKDGGGGADIPPRCDFRRPTISRTVSR